LSHLVRLDLSKNMLEELPEYFGQLRNLVQLASQLIILALF
jgi:hypothetical protein